MENKQAIEQLRNEGKEIYAQMGQAYEKKDWLNFAVLSDQLKGIKEDIARLEADEKDLGVER